MIRSGLLPSRISVLLHVAVLLGLLALNFVLPEYHRGMVSRVLVLSVFAMGYNLTFGYTGLLSLGHAMFFAAGLYGTGLTIHHLGWSVWPAFASGLAAGAALSFCVGLLALRTAGVAFMIVTMMFAQIVHLATLHFTALTRGEEGIVLARAARVLEFPMGRLDLTDPSTRYLVALALFGIVLAGTLFLVRAPFGRSLTGIRDNEERLQMLGYDIFATKLAAVVVSGLVCASAGSAYAVLFGYVGSGFASIQYSILPLLWVLLGGAATTLGPFIGTLSMFYVIDVTSEYTSAYLLVVGLVLVGLILFFPRGIAGTVRERWLPWLP